MVSMAADTDIRDPAALFRSIDNSSDGELDKKEFRKALRLVGMDVSNDEATELFTCLDKDKSGSISLQEFGAVMAVGRNIYNLPSFTKRHAWSAGAEEREKWRKRSIWVASRKLRRYVAPIVSMQRFVRGYLCRRRYCSMLVSAKNMHQ